MSFMQLTKQQRRMLEIYRWYRAHPPSLRFYLSAMLWRSARWLYVGVFAIAVLIVIGRATIFGSLTYIILGLLLGFVVRDVIYYRQTTLVWPVFDEIIDWGKVEALLQPASDSIEPQDKGKTAV
jgi:hypothetical protein